MWVKTKESVGPSIRGKAEATKENHSKEEDNLLGKERNSDHVRERM